MSGGLCRLDYLGMTDSLNKLGQVPLTKASGWHQQKGRLIGHMALEGSPVWPRRSSGGCAKKATVTIWISVCATCGASTCGLVGWDVGLLRCKQASNIARKSVFFQWKPPGLVSNQMLHDPPKSECAYSKKAANSINWFEPTSWSASRMIFASSPHPRTNWKWPMRNDAVDSEQAGRLCWIQGFDCFRLHSLIAQAGWKPFHPGHRPPTSSLGNQLPHQDVIQVYSQLTAFEFCWKFRKE